MLLSVQQCKFPYSFSRAEEFTNATSLFIKIFLIIFFFLKLILTGIGIITFLFVIYNLNMRRGVLSHPHFYIYLQHHGLLLLDC